MKPSSNTFLFNKILITTMILAMLSGSYTFDRIIDINFAIPEFVNSVKNVLFIILFLLVLLRLLSIKFRAMPIQRLPKVWLVSVSIFFLYMATSALWSPSLESAAPRLPDYIMLLLLVLSIPVIIGNPQERGIEFMAKLVLAVGIMYAVMAIVRPTVDLQGRIAAFGGGPNVFVRTIGTSILMAIYLWIKTKRTIWLFFVVPLFATAVLSGSRGGMLALGTSLSIFGWLIITNKQVQYFKIIGMTSVASVILPFIPAIYGPVMSVWQSRFYEQTIDQRYLSMRDVLFQISWDMFQQRPYFGFGLEGFALLSNTGLSYPHNMFLEFAVEGGAVALGLFIFIIVLVIVRLRLPMTWENGIALVSSILIFVASMFSGGFYDTRFLWLFLTLFMFPAYQYPRHQWT